ncbi:MAG: MBL fold metallo-hydrolase [Bacteroidetes bacterium]|nr:MBL fold metallo-hydrolase [Bacteroidota bacterium]MBU1371772.1 MBL fold metallo-hydrolase [Bacteroidota bacterium]MBU1485358.1 MBL fold metallo-hydrolase [Bacteroidota bacterium]MBU1759490.1 MBL fold metallo-hydrolase [Bacteroidota bacterium]MBU2046952.1 MBL fold metallo-hydrolase [Bacteroidota bacterium]
MKITFHGAAQTVTGSKHLLELNSGTRILLDCGLFQGRGSDTDAMNKDFGFDPKSVDFLILSHAHIDHSGLIPRLVKEGFEGHIISTPATYDLCKILLQDSARIQEYDIKYTNKKRAKAGKPLFEPLYTIKDALTALSYFKKVKYGIVYQIEEGVTLSFEDAGHIIGSASVHLNINEGAESKKISFSGDVGRYKDLILKAPKSFRQADYILLESTYGDSLHDDANPAENKLLEIITDTCVNRKGKVIIPAFSVGRTQEILYSLNNLELKGKLPDVKYFVDSPLSEKATLVVKAHPWNFNDKVQEVLKVDDDPFDFKGLHFVEDADESKALNDDHSPMVIISSSGMAEAGRVKHHIKNNIENPNSTILMVGYAEPASLAGRLKNGVNPVSIFGDYYQVNAQVVSMQSMSAHGDQHDLLHFLACQDKSKIKKIFLVHGEIDVQNNFKTKLQKEGYGAIEIPYRHQSFEI